MFASVPWAALALLQPGPAIAQAQARQADARFDWVRYEGRDAAPAQTGPALYRNPVLPGFQPDPSVVRVGDDYYLVNSSFGWFPGIPVYHSRDLVNWRQIGNAIDRPGQLDFGRLPVVTKAVYAPAISFHDGRFYILNTCVDCGGNFLITATNPAGPWSDPVWLDFEGIDPSLFFDEDGRAWVVNNGAPVGEPRYQGHRAIWIQQFDAKAGKLIGPRSVLVDGGAHPQDKPIWAEGPHLYKVDGWYYLMAAEGGTAEDHSETIYRSRAVTGPYVPGPVNPILTQRDLPAGRPHAIEAAGHADLIQIPDGSWWAVFLATRPYRGQLTSLGRETFLLPVSWHDGWPLILPAGATIPLSLPRPALKPDAPVDWTQWAETFDGPGLAPDWLRLRTPRGTPWWSLDKGALALAPRPVAAGDFGQPSFLGKRLRHETMTMDTRLDFAPAQKGARAGLLVLMAEANFFFAGRERLADGRDALVLRRRGKPDEPAQGVLVASLPAPASSAIELRFTLDRDKASAFWRAPGGVWQRIASDVDAINLASVNAGLFTGTVAGPFAEAGAD